MVTMQQESEYLLRHYEKRERERQLEAELLRRSDSEHGFAAADETRTFMQKASEVMFGPRPEIKVRWEIK